MIASTLEDLIEFIVAFRDERNWKQYHTPRNLAAAISIEAAELQELFLWKGSEDDSVDLNDQELLEKVRAEAADVLIYTLLFCDTLDIEPTKAVADKLKVNAERYPVDLAHGSAKKYTELDDTNS